MEQSFANILILTLKAGKFAFFSHQKQFSFATCIKENLILKQLRIFNLFTSFNVDTEFENGHTFETGILNLYRQSFSRKAKKKITSAFNSESPYGISKLIQVCMSNYDNMHSCNVLP